MHKCAEPDEYALGIANERHVEVKATNVFIQSVNKSIGYAAGSNTVRATSMVSSRKQEVDQSQLG